MNVSIRSLLICLIVFTSCNYESEKILTSELYEESTSVDIKLLKGTWTNYFESDSKDGILYSSTNDGTYEFQWTFTEDSVYVTDNSIQLLLESSYKIKDDSLVFHDGYPIPFQNSAYKALYVGDTLIVEYTVGLRKRMVKQYFFKNKKVNNDIEILIRDKINWSLFFGEVREYVIYKDDMDIDTIHQYPMFLDLTDKNKNNYYTSRDTLFYTD